MKRKLEETEQAECEMASSRKTARLDITMQLGFDTAEVVDLRNVMTKFLAVYEKLGGTTLPDEKPNYSYTEMIFLAILDAPNFCLTAPEIYKHIQKKFLYFRNDTKAHWRNAVRHSLSKTKCFMKINVGKKTSATSFRPTFLWSIHPQSLTSFVRGDYRTHKADKYRSDDMLLRAFHEDNTEAYWDKVVDSLQVKIQNFQICLGMASDPVSYAQQQASASTGSDIISGETTSVSPVSFSQVLVSSELLSPIEPEVQLCPTMEVPGRYSFVQACDSPIDDGRRSSYGDFNSGVSFLSVSGDSDCSRDVHSFSPVSAEHNICDNVREEPVEPGLCYNNVHSPPSYGYDYLYYPTLSAADYISRGVVTCGQNDELSPLESLTTGCHGYLYPDDPYATCESYLGYLYDDRMTQCNFSY
ncbi:uncharacterized protein [Haliotis cracherodii]|uniref:uncharacterized protein n=1 Tax=Haliotis cracherodii TaxID=6455 RepID=UPI0039E97A57